MKHESLASKKFESLFEVELLSFVKLARKLRSVSQDYIGFCLHEAVALKKEMVNLGDVFPDFHIRTTEGELDFHKFIEGT